MDRFIHLNKPSQAGLLQRTGCNPSDTHSPERLGESVRQLFESSLAAHYKKTEGLLEIWPRILPKELEGHCSIEQIKDGLLQVRADLPCYAYQFRLHSDEILNLIKEFCPSAKIRQIKVGVRAGQSS